MPETITTRLTAFAASLREAGAIHSGAVEHAFASVERHRCVPEFRYGPHTISVPQDRLPGSEVLDIVYSHQSLLTSTGRDGGPPSSSSAPTLMARMLEALDLEPGMRVLEIGAGTGYNAALIATITGAPVLTIDAGATTAQTGGVHPILAANLHNGVNATAVLWADFMPATGPLRPAQLAGHDPADYIPPAPITRIPRASPARTTAAYHDL